MLFHPSKAGIKKNDLYMVAIVFGLPGSGKSYFASRLANLINAEYINSDIVRRTFPDKKTYSLNEKLSVYIEMLKRMKETLKENRKIVLDATFYKSDIRRRFINEANQNEKISFIEVMANESVISERLNKTRADSEADFDVYIKIKTEWEPFDQDHLILQSTDNNIKEMLHKAAGYLQAIKSNLMHINKAENYLQKQIDEFKTPCLTYCIFDKDNIIYQFVGGLANIHEQTKANNETTFNAFSVTKTFTALAIVQLAEQGKLDSEQPVKNYLPDFPYSSDITIRQLLTHSAGIPNPIPLNWIHLIDEHSSFDRNHFFNTIFVKHNKTKSKPNEKFAYSNLGYFLLGRVIENVAGKVYEQYINENIIKKLDLQPRDLGFIINDTFKHANGYVKEVSFANMILGLFIDKSKYLAKTEGKWQPFNNYYVNGTSYGGLIGTSNAFVKYIQELLRPNCKLITNNYKDLLFIENYTRANKATGMCMSWFSGELIGKKYFSHAGGGGGYYCEIRMYPDLGIGSVIMFNRTGMKDKRFLNTVDKYFINKN